MDCLSRAKSRDGLWTRVRQFTVFLLSLLTVGIQQTVHGTPHDQVGVIVLAHGGSPDWNRVVTETVAHAQLPVPTEIVFGMGMHAQEVRHLQEAIDRLQQGGVDRIVAIPLLISSSSEVMRQYQYLLKLRTHGPWEQEAKPVTAARPIAMTPALDDDPAVAQVLSERVREVSRDPRNETVVIVAHGPTGAEDNHQWLAAMNRLAAEVKQLGSFRKVLPVTMRDDAPQAVQQAATRKMRALVRHASQRGQVVVVPLLLANGGVEQKIPKRLEGLTYIYQSKALLPHPALAQWLTNHVRTAVALSHREIDVHQASLASTTPAD